MKPTRRGVAAVAVIVAGFAMAASFGPRALNAIVIPLAVAVVAGFVQVWRIEPPRATRRLPAEGFPGDAGTVTLAFETDAPFVATVRDRLPDGVEGDAAAEATVGTDPVSYEIRYRERGEHTVGPVELVARDVMGLTRRRLLCESTDEVLVYPRLRPLNGAARRELANLFDPSRNADRDEFDRLREYARGDSLRDVHWKSSAKRDDLMVAEYVADAEETSVTVTAGTDFGAGSDGESDGEAADDADPDGIAEGELADEMAEAAASLTVALLSAGIPVRLSTPSGVIDAAPNDRSAVLQHLARADGGDPPDPDANVVIRAAPTTTTVLVGDRETTFARLSDDADAPRADAEPGTGEVVA